MDYVDLTVAMAACVFVGGFVATLIQEQFNG